MPLSTELDWFISYLSNKRQCCHVNGNISEIQGIKCGVLKGSCLGPFPFLIYINDLPLALQRTKVAMYADDTSISYSSKSVSDLCNAINSDLQNLGSLLKGNKSSLNVGKIQSMILGTAANLRRLDNNDSNNHSLF